MVDSDNDVPAEESMHASKKVKSQWDIYQNNGNIPINGNRILMPIGNGLYKIIEIKEKIVEKTTNNTGEKSVKAGSLEKSITIINVENPGKFRNPIYLESAVNKKFPKAINGYVMKYGDIRVWFENEKDANEATLIETNEIFGKHSKVRKSNYNETKIAVYALPKELSIEEIRQYLNKCEIIADEIRIVQRINGKSRFNTAFISITNGERRRKILEAGKIRIGFCYYPVKKYMTRKIIQCHKCQELGHIARSCTSPNEVCGICSKDHLTKACNNMENKKCINCGKDEPSFHNDCKKKKDLEIINKNKITKSKNNREKKNVKKQINVKKTGTYENRYENGEKNEIDINNKITDIKRNRQKINIKGPDTWEKIETEIDKKINVLITDLYKHIEKKLDEILNKLTINILSKNTETNSSHLS